MTIELTKFQKDLFNEIGNVGAGHAATSLSTMLNKQVNISLPEMKITNINNVIENNDDELLIVSCKIAGDLEGNLLVFFKKETAFPLIDMMMSQKKGTVKEIDEMGKSAFKEMVNIVGGTYLDSLAEMLGFRLMPQPPVFSYGKFIGVKDQILKELPQDNPEIIYVVTEMSIEGEVIFGDILIIFDKPSMEKIMKAIDSKVGGNVG